MVSKSEFVKKMPHTLLPQNQPNAITEHNIVDELVAVPSSQFIPSEKDTRGNRIKFTGYSNSHGTTPL